MRRRKTHPKTVVVVVVVVVVAERLTSHFYLPRRGYFPSVLLSFL